MFFHRKGDVLYISIGSPKEAISKEVNDDILVRVQPETEEIVGFTILNFVERFSDLKKEQFVPIKAQFESIEDNTT
ncbi:MAG: DUF2283 domain-containing protein [Caldithrix sp.]|nr:MAG: DUF2283 domain-containing protein [Caldithrix sp.]TDI96402.1 MAG: DUF2283 domain-containing protein [Caldithrix sp.]